MIDSITQLIAFLKEPAVIGWLVAGSVLYLLALLLFMPFVAAKIPQDYFSSYDKKPYAPQNLIVYLLYKILKNLIGAVFVLVGLILLLTPGQGILGILIGSLMLDYPGKYHFQRWLIAKKPVLNGLNWLRKKGGAEPLEVMEQAP